MARYRINKYIACWMLWAAGLVASLPANAAFVRDRQTTVLLGVNTKTGTLMKNIRTHYPARESSVLRNLALVSKTSLQIHEFELKQAGSYSAALHDLRFPTSFSHLELNIQPLDALFGTGGITLDKHGTVEFDAEAGSYVAVVNARADEGRFGSMGIYGFEIASITPVPIPMAVVSFVSGLLLFGFPMLQRRSHDLN